MAKTLPSSTAIKRSYCSASSIYAVAINTLMLGRRRRISAMSSQNWRRDKGSTPVVGSSKINKSGSWMSAQHKPNFCFIPPDNFCAGRSAKFVMPVLANKSLMRAWRSCLDCPNSLPKKSIFSNTDKVGYKFLPNPCGIYAICAHTLRRCWALRMSPPNTSISPSWILRAPAIKPNHVDLPTPSGPIKPTMQPAGISTVTWSAAIDAP